MTTIVHISDTHFGTEIPVVVSAIERAIRQIEPDIVILSGDITQRARKSQFQAAAAFLSGLPAKAKLVIPGNHDIPLYNLFARFIAPYHNYRQVFGPRESIWRNNDLCIISFDATSPFRHTRGQLSRQSVQHQMGQIKDKLSPDAFLIVSAHQPLLTAWPQDADEVLIGHEET